MVSFYPISSQYFQTMDTLGLFGHVLEGSGDILVRDDITAGQKYGNIVFSLPATVPARLAYGSEGRMIRLPWRPTSSYASSFRIGNIKLELFQKVFKRLEPRKPPPDEVKRPRGGSSAPPTGTTPNGWHTAKCSIRGTGDPKRYSRFSPSHISFALQPFCRGLVPQMRHAPRPDLGHNSKEGV